jgi:hypothetical protein
MTLNEWFMLIGFVAQLIVLVFYLGRICKGVEATQADVVALKKSYARDHQAIVQLVTEHRMNHDSDLTAPALNGNGG